MSSPPHKKTEHESTPREGPHHPVGEKSETKQKQRTESEMTDFWSEKHKLDRQVHTLPQGEYSKRLNLLASKYNLSRKEQLDFLEISDRDTK